MKTVTLLFPHQLFSSHPGIYPSRDIVLVESPLFFGTDPQYPCQMHRQKLLLHRTSMRWYADELRSQGQSVSYVEFHQGSLQAVLEDLGKQDYRKVVVVDPVDFVLSKRLKKYAQQLGMELEILDTPLFLNTKQDNEIFFGTKERFRMQSFYQYQRKRLRILMEEDGKPVGGKWSFDAENRKKLPQTLRTSLSPLPSIHSSTYLEEAKLYVQKHFSKNPGKIDHVFYPTSHAAASEWLDDFLTHRFANFGPYEDAIEPDQNWLYHSVLTPMLNIGLLTPKQILDRALQYAQNHEIPLASLEGFVRQVIGWREFMRGTYERLGPQMRNGNFWNHTHPMPSCFYDVSSGVEPVDNAIHRILETGYCHHIERLMVLGGFFFLCEVHPQSIYQWFMELFVDSYDWVMVPNVYAMSQNSCGGLITTKPYFSGSAYIRKMSHYPAGEWCEVWDGLYWRFMHKHKEELRKNPRWAMMVSMVEKMDQGKLSQHVKVAEHFLRTIRK